MNGHGYRIVIAGLAALGQLALAGVQTAQVRVKVPGYEVVKFAGLDEARIPGGQILEVEEGRPLVPYWIETVQYPTGTRVQDVKLVGKDGLRTDSGLRLPAVCPDTTALDHEEITPGVYPQREFDWNQVEEPDRTFLSLHIYPFRYDPAAKTVEFHQDYVFEVSSVQSGVSINTMVLDPPACDPGERMAVRVGLANTGAPVEVRLTGTVVRGDEVVTELPAKGIGRLKGADSTVLELATGDLRTGEYRFRTVALDGSGNELARSEEPFRLGVPRGEVTGFSVEPRVFKPGADVRLELTLTNTGKSDLSGECVFRIYKAGEVIDELGEEMAGLKPGVTRTFRRKWSTAGAERGTVYRVVGFVRYDGTASGHRSVDFSTNAVPEARFTVSADTAAIGEELTFDAGGSTDGDGTVAACRWDFGDGGDAAGSVVAHAYWQPGEYEVRLTVADNEGGTGEAVRVVTVLEE